LIKVVKLMVVGTESHNGIPGPLSIGRCTWKMGHKQWQWGGAITGVLHLTSIHCV